MPSSPILLTKHHGLGNDFLLAVVDAADAAALPDGDSARAWCDRRTGVGADGLIVATPEGSTGGGERRRWRMVLWNADGGRAEISGNGIRCLGQALVRHLDLDLETDQELEIETDAGTRILVIKQGGSIDEVLVRVGMGKAVAGPTTSEAWSKVGLVPDLQVGVDIGNPHLVAFFGSVAEIDMGQVGPTIEADYPSGLNVHGVEVLDRGRLRLKIWERGAGLTQACGSGACASAWAAANAGLVDSSVVVEMPGGQAEVELDGDEVFLIGPAVFVAEVRIQRSVRSEHVEVSVDVR